MTKLAHFFLKKAGVCKKVERYHICTRRDTRNNIITLNRMLIVKKGFIETGTIASLAAAIALFLGVATTVPNNNNQPSVLQASTVNHTFTWSQVTDPAANGLYFDLKKFSQSWEEGSADALPANATSINKNLDCASQYNWRVWVQTGSNFGEGYYHTESNIGTGSCPAAPPPPPAATPTPKPPPTTTPPPTPVKVTPAILNPNVNQACANESFVNITFSWTPAKDATFDLHYLDIGTSNQGPWSGTQLNVGQKFVQIDNIAHDTQIYWRINTHVAGGDWYPSEVSSLKTNSCAPATPPADPDGLGVLNQPPCVNGASYSQIVKWNPVANAQTYFVRVDYGSRGIVDKDVGNNTQVSIPDLYPNESYFWAVSAWNANGISPGAGSTIEAIPSCQATPPPPPAGGPPAQPPAQPPAGIPPAPASVKFVNSDCRDFGFGPLPTFTFSWSKVASAEGYWFDVSENSSFSPFSNIPIAGSNNTTFTWDLDHPMQDGKFPDSQKPYYFRVTSYNSAGVYIPQTVGSTSVARDCTTDSGTPTQPPPEPPPTTTPPAPEPEFPPEPAVLNREVGQTCTTDSLVNITFSWTPATGATFDLQYIDINTTGQDPWPTGTQLAVGQNITTIANIAHNTPIYWRINTHVAGGDWYPSQVFSLQTNHCGTTPAPPVGTPIPVACNAPGTFNLKDPSGTTKDPFPSFQWTNATGEDQYFLDLSDNNFASWWYAPVGQNITTSPWPSWNSEFANGPAEEKLWSGLTPGKDYQWRVAAMKTCQDGNKYTQSEVFTLRYEPQSPTQPPAAQVFAATALNAGPRDDGFGSPGLVGSYDPATGIGGYFGWQYDTRNDIHSFIRQVVYLKHDDGQIPTPSNALKVGEFERNIQTFSLSGLTPNQPHAWNIYTCADEACTFNAKSSADKFQTIDIPKDQPPTTPPPPPTGGTPPAPPQASLPAAPILNAPANGTEFNLNEIANIVFSWQDPKGNATNYWLDVSQNANFSQWNGCTTTETIVGYQQCSWLKFQKDATGGASLIGDGDMPFASLDGTYYFRVAASNDAGFAPAPSEIRRFTVVKKNPAPEIPIPPATPTEPTTPTPPVQNEPAVLGIVEQEQNCTQDGKVPLIFNWTLGKPSAYILSQWIDVSKNSTFTGDYFATTNPPGYGGNFYQTGTLSNDPGHLGWQIPHLEPNTTYYWTINTLFEGNPAWHLSSSAQFTTKDCTKIPEPEAPSEAQLVIKSATLKSTTFAPDTPVVFDVTIQNIGKSEAKNYWTTVLANSPNPLPCLARGGISLGSIQPGSEITKTVSTTFKEGLTPIAEGTYTARLFVDSSCEYGSNTQSQQASAQYSVVQPQILPIPEPLSFTSPATVPPSDFICDVQAGKWSATFKWLPGYVVENGQERFAAEIQQIDWKSEKISGWTPGSYSIAGPFGANIKSSILESIESNDKYVWRVANLYNGVWYHSGEQTFVTESCGPKDFQVLIAEKTLQVEPGASTTYSIQFDYTSGWNEKINLSPANGQPIAEPSITASYDPPSSSTLDRTTSVVKLKLQTNQTTPQNKYDFEIKACSTSNVCRTSSSTLEVKKVNVPAGTIFPKCGNNWADSAPPPGIYIGNFAVPNCDYNPDALYAYMFSYGRSIGISDANINFFFSPVIKLESGYYPNVTAQAINGIAYGLFQWTVPAEWHKQVQYAFNYFQEHRLKAGSPFYCGWGYWQAARENPVQNKWTAEGCL